MSELIYYVNGRFVSKDKACLPLNDLGIVRGYGVFDFMRTYRGRLFRLQDHLRRLENSARVMRIEIPWTTAEIENIILETLARNDLPEARMRVLMTGGVSEDAITPVGDPSLAIIVAPLHSYPAEYYECGTKVITVAMERFLPSAKSLNYICAILALREARATGAVEALYVDQHGHILEGTTTNFLVFRGDQLITPRDNVLEGVTKKVILELAQKHFEIVERDIALSEISAVDEAFICASNKEIMPVVRIDDITVGQGEPGENTRKLMKLFREYIEFGAW